jgi:alkylation response protein AidB-like acyl-CoA dehydrogenase
MLVNTLARYLGDRYSFEDRDRIATSEQGWSSTHWAALAELGVVGALFSPDAGGFGGGGFDVGAIFEQLGKALVVEPFLGALMAGPALEKTGGFQDLIDAAISGQSVLAFAYQEEQNPYDLADIVTTVRNIDGNWMLTGIKTVVPQIESATHFIVTARTPGHRTGLSHSIVAGFSGGAAGSEAEDCRVIRG